MSQAATVPASPTPPATLGWFLALLLATTLLRDLGGGPLAAWGAAGFYLLALGMAFRDLGREEKLLLTAAAGSIAAVLVFAADRGATLTIAFERATFLASFMLSLAALREAARTSPALRRCGDTLVRQPPGRRYLALMLGGHTLGFILNLGALSLLATAVREANTLAAAGSERVRAIRERRMMTAMVRGFSTIMLWSPLSMSVAVALTLIPDLSWSGLLTTSLPMAAVLLALGWLVDRWRWPRKARSGIQPEQAEEPLRLAIFAPILGLTASILTAVLAVQTIFDSSFIVAVMVAAPLASAVWIYLQRRALTPGHMTPGHMTPGHMTPGHLTPGQGTATRETLQRLRKIVEDDFPHARREVTILSTAAVIGTCMAALVPDAAVSGLIEGLSLHPVALAAVISMIIVLAAQIALNPVLAATIIGGLAAGSGLNGLDPEFLGLAVLTGWSIAVVSSPYTAPALIIARIIEGSSRVVGRGWNVDYAASAWIAAVAVFTFIALWR